MVVCIQLPQSSWSLVTRWHVQAQSVWCLPMGCCIAGNELFGGASPGAPRPCCQERPREDSSTRENHGLRAGKAARRRREGVSRRGRQGKAHRRMNRCAYVGACARAGALKTGEKKKKRVGFSKRSAAVSACCLWSLWESSEISRSSVRAVGLQWERR